LAVLILGAGMDIRCEIACDFFRRSHKCILQESVAKGVRNDRGDSLRASTRPLGSGTMRGRETIDSERGHRGKPKSTRPTVAVDALAEQRPTRKFCPV
jgi:hypothetical protein